MELLKQYGMGDVLFWNWGSSVAQDADKGVEQFENLLKAVGGEGIGTAEGKKWFAHILRAIKAGEAKYGWPDMVIGPFDEALANQDATREVIAAMPLVQAISPKSRVYMTEWHKGFTRLYQSGGESLKGKNRPGDSPGGSEYKFLSGKKPVFNFAVIGSNNFDDESREVQSALGAEYWNYTGIATVAPQARFAQGFQTWILKNEASLLWRNWGGSFDEQGWTIHLPMPDDPANKRDSRGPCLASVKGAVAREGIDDRKYIETLRYYATEKKSKADLDWLDKELPAKCKPLAKGLEKMGGIDNTEAMVSSTSELQALRIEIKNRIVKLVK